MLFAQAPKTHNMFVSCASCVQSRAYVEDCVFRDLDGCARRVLDSGDKFRRIVFTDTAGLDSTHVRTWPIRS